MKRYCAGFTLIELMVVLTVAVVLLTIGIPSFRSVMADRRATASVNELLAGMRLARSEAIKTAHYVSVCKSADGATCGDEAVDWEDGWIVFSNASSAAPDVVDVGDLVIRVGTALPGDLTLRTSGALEDFISYRPSGSAGTTVQNLGGTLTLCDPRGLADTRALNIAASGSMNISYDADLAGAALACP